MKKVLTTLAGVLAAGIAALAVAALAGATQSQGSPKAHDKADRVLFASLNGRNEIGPDGRRGAGDPDGSGGFTAVIDDVQVCFGLTVDDIAVPVAAHIHRGRAGENGPIVVSLIAPSSGDPGASSGCVPPDGGDTDVLREILRDPSGFYANVHTGDFPDGAVRGQLHR